MMRRIDSWDIFCRVIDNYGDVGVCWRLARQLAVERGDTVRLWVDDLGALVRIWPEVIPGVEAQHRGGVDIRRWIEPLSPEQPHDVVIEAFACKTPDSFAVAMAARSPQPVWINLEYLSAEAWVDGCHLLRSPHPRLPLVKYFFFPGFTPRTGGLLRERDLIARREAFRSGTDAQRAFWRSVGLPPPAAGELRVSLFAYANPAAAGVFSAWAGGERLVTCVVPEDILVNEIAGFFGACPAVGATATRGNLRLAVIPFLRQVDYDPLLWACHVNFVRGEDSFVRAQWAAAPLVWHIYPQDDDAHIPKLRAFLERYCAGMSGSAAAAVGDLFHGWNGSGDPAAAWAVVLAALPDWTKHAQDWAATLGTRQDLVSALAEAAQNRL